MPRQRQADLVAAVGAVDCEHRYGVHILIGARDAGLLLQDLTTRRFSA